MNFRDLEYLVAVAEVGHFGQAALRCGASQSALSLQLQKLEAGLGVQLIERTQRRVVVTPAGHIIVARARAVLRARQELLDSAARETGCMPAVLRIGMIPTIAPYRMRPLVKALRREHPATRVQFVEDLTDALASAVADGSLDAAVLATPVTDALLESHTLEHDELLAALPKGHPLADLPRLTPEKFATEPLLLLKDGHCLKAQVIESCPAHARDCVLSVAASIETLLALVHSGEGVTLVPHMAAATSAARGLVLVPLTSSPSRVISLVTRRTSRLGKELHPLAARAFSGSQSPQ